MRNSNRSGNESSLLSRSRSRITLARRSATLILLAATAFSASYSNGDDKAQVNATSSAAPKVATLKEVSVTPDVSEKVAVADKLKLADKAATETKSKAKETAEEPVLDRSVLIPTTGKSVLPSDVSVSKDSGTVEIHVNEANLVEVLRMLSMQSNTNILPSKEVRGSVTANLYDVTVKEALPEQEVQPVLYNIASKELPMPP